MAEQNKEIVRRYLEAFAANDQGTLRELFSPEHTYHSSAGPVDGESRLQGINMFGAAFSDMDVTIHDHIAEGDTIATRLTWRAVHSGNFQGHPPTNKEIEVNGISIERVSDGKIAESWFIQDELGMMQQLGILPPP
ncbi:MAG TPA: ester cyclase [Candidatus Sulfomarinibacteraceae bacterium]|nr:ester cyclase [Candidatus Sulfomarinibacteraceae bacterium]